MCSSKRIVTVSSLDQTIPYLPLDNSNINKSVRAAELDASQDVPNTNSVILNLIIFFSSPTKLIKVPPLSYRLTLYKYFD